jgi:hypothetical protein
MWLERNQSTALLPPVFGIHGTSGSSMLAINGLNHSGVYMCQVGGAAASFVVEVERMGKRLYACPNIYA